jgi:hypothetical protein
VTQSWQEVGRNLGVQENKLQNLISNNPDEREEQAYQMFVHWRQSNKKPTLKQLLEALIDADLVEQARHISGE